MKQKLSLRERLCYGSGDFGSQFAFMMISTYLLIFMTDVAGLSTKAAGMVMLVAMIFDAVNDVAIGIIADRSKLRKTGHYRPFMMAAAIPYGIFLFLCFVSPSDNYMVKMLWAYATYLIFTVVSTFFQVPYGSAASVMTADPQERVTLGAFRDWGANLASFFLNLFAVKIITGFSADGQSMDARGYMFFAIIIGICTTVFCLISSFGIKERYQPEKNSAEIGKSLKSVFQNGPALCLLGMVFFINFFVAFKGTFTPYYAIYYLGNPDMITAILTTTFTLPLLGLLFVPKLNALLGSQKMFYISAACAMLSGVFSLVAKTNSVLIVISAVFAGLTMSGIYANIWGNMPNAADYGEWKTGIRAPGLIYSLGTFSIKLAGAFAAYGVSWVLDLSGYNAALEVQSDAVNNAMYMTNGIVPIVCGIIAIVIIFFYRLDNAKMEQIRVDLAARRGE